MHTVHGFMHGHQTAGVRDMTKGNPYTLMIGFALPVLLSQLFQQLYNTADAFIVGRCLGTDALAAVTSSGTLIFLMISFFMGVAMGGGVVISRYFGAGKADEVSRAIHTVLAFGIVSGVLLTGVGVAFTPTMLRWMQTDPQVMPLAVEYFRYYFLGSLALVLYNICRSIINALGDSRSPLYYLIFFLAAEHCARRVVFGGVPLGRVVGGGGYRAVAGGQCGFVHAVSAAQGEPVYGGMEKDPFPP